MAAVRVGHGSRTEARVGRPGQAAGAFGGRASFVPDDGRGSRQRWAMGGGLRPGGGSVGSAGGPCGARGSFYPTTGRAGYGRRFVAGRRREEDRGNGGPSLRRRLPPTHTDTSGSRAHVRLSGTGRESRHRCAMGAGLRPRAESGDCGGQSQAPGDGARGFQLTRTCRADAGRRRAGSRLRWACTIRRGEAIADATRRGGLQGVRTRRGERRDSGSMRPGGHWQRAGRVAGQRDADRGTA